MALSLKQLKTDREALQKEFEQAQQLALISNPNVNKLQGAINYIDSCIKRLEKK